MGIYCMRDNWSRAKPKTECNYAHKPPTQAGRYLIFNLLFIYRTGREIFDLYYGCL